MTSDLGEAAIAYAAKGWAVFPLSPGNKVPLPGSKGCCDATTDTNQIKHWWRRCPTCNVGVATGAVSGVAVVDVDPRHNGIENFEALYKPRGGLDTTLLSITGSGGWHLWYSYWPSAKNTASDICDGVDTRGDGGYVVAPPSRTSADVHPPNGGYYKWHNPDERIIPVPDWILERLSTVRRRSKAGAVDPAYFVNLLKNGAPVGARNDAVTRFLGYLLRRRVDPYLAFEIVSYWNFHLSEPLSIQEMENIFNSIGRREIRRRKRI